MGLESQYTKMATRGGRPGPHAMMVSSPLPAYIAPARVRMKRGGPMTCSRGGGTTTGLDATHRPPICQNLWGGELGGGGRLEGVEGGGGYWRLGKGGGGGPKVGGPVRNQLLPHAYLQGGCASEGLGVWKYVCDISAFLSLPGYILLIWRSGHGWFDEREACTKKIEGRWHPPTHYLSKPGGGGVRGGGSHTRTGPAPPPGTCCTCCKRGRLSREGPKTKSGYLENFLQGRGKKTRGRGGASSVRIIIPLVT